MELSVKKNRNWRNILLFFFLAAAVLVALNFFQNPVRNFFYLISAPIQKTFWRAGDWVSDFFEAVSEMKNLKKENEELELKIQSLLAENVQFSELKKENEDLRTALNLGLEKEFSLIFGEVIAKDISQDSLVIDKGSDDGISKGQPVITPEKNLVGRIGEVYKNFSKVMLISHKDSSFDGEIVGSKILGLVKGNGNFKVFFDLVPKDKDVKRGGLIITVALGGIFPEGLVVGEVKDVKKSDVEPFQQIEISPSYDVKELEQLFIISGKND
jgi:rod shape-determining protein MreC